MPRLVLASLVRRVGAEVTTRTGASRHAHQRNTARIGSANRQRGLGHARRDLSARLDRPAGRARPVDPGPEGADRGLDHAARLARRRRVRRARRLGDRRQAPAVPAHDRARLRRRERVRRDRRALVLALLPRRVRPRVLPAQARQARRQAGLDHPGAGRRPGSGHDAPGDRAVRRVPVEGERQARSACHEGERAAGLLEWRESAARLQGRRGRAARRTHQEEARRRSGRGRDRPADLSPVRRRRPALRADGRQGDHDLAQRAWASHAHWRTLGRRPRARAADQPRVRRQTALQSHGFEITAAEVRKRIRLLRRPTDHHRGAVRSRAEGACGSQSQRGPAADRERSDPAHWSRRPAPPVVAA